jgi:hypothetical protein
MFFYADTPEGRARAAEAWARVTLGTTIMMAVADLTASGQITGAAPSDPSQRAALKASGKIPYSATALGYRVQYSRADPFGMHIGIAADIMTTAMRMDDDYERDRMFLSGALMFAENLGSKTYLRGIVDAIDALKNHERAASYYIGQQASAAVPFSPILRQIAQYQHPEFVETRTAVGDPDVDARIAEGMHPATAEYVQSLVNQIRANIPGLGKDAPSRYDLLGRVETREGPLGPIYDSMMPYRVTSANAGHEFDALMVEHHWRFEKPRRTIHGVRLTAQEYADYSQMSGGIFRTIVEMALRGGDIRALIRQSPGPDGAAHLQFQRFLLGAKDRAQRQMMDANPELKARVYALVKAKGETLSGGGLLADAFYEGTGATR